ncbi:hypothetical protein EDC01DRAFT_531485 [Geopyxis carbonaria]|nr:hypothetical protein EDC01DRAFT_531485 [Geopyxis carbonaria]
MSASAYILVVFGGGIGDDDIVSDFAGFSKYFREDQKAEVTSISSIDLGVFIRDEPLLFGKEGCEFGRRKVYSAEEHTAAAGNFFYTLVAEQSLKPTILNWSENVAHRAQAGDSVLLIFCAHGHPDGRIQLGLTPGLESTLEWFEISVSLNKFSTGISVTILNSACYSGGWARNIRNTSTGRELIHAACQSGDTTPASRSTSGAYRCGVFPMEVVNALLARGSVLNYRDRVALHCSRSTEPFLPDIHMDPASATNENVVTWFHAWPTAIVWESATSIFVRLLANVGGLFGAPKPRGVHAMECAIRNSNILSRPDTSIFNQARKYLAGTLRQEEVLVLQEVIRTRRRLQRTVFEIFTNAVDSGVLSLHALRFGRNLPLKAYPAPSGFAEIHTQLNETTSSLTKFMCWHLHIFPALSKKYVDGFSS